MNYYERIRDEYFLNKMIKNIEFRKKFKEEIPKQSGEKVKFIKESKLI